MAKRNYVPKYKWKLVKNGTHSGYWRKGRPKGKKIKTDKYPVKLYPRRDENGRILGYKSK